MLDQIFNILETAASSEHAALLIALAATVALGWGWWRRETAHSSRYDTLIQALGERDDEVAALARDAFEVLQEVAAALAGMERTLDGVETLIHTVLNERLHGGKDEEST